MTLTEFLLARIHEDEAVARATPPREEYERPGDYGMRFLSWESDHDKADTEFVSRFDPSRALAECAAKRRIVEQCEEMCERDRMDAGTGYWEEAADASLAAVRALASVYAGHPDYRPLWPVVGVTHRPRILRTPRQPRRKLLNPAARSRAEKLLVEMEELQKTLPHGL